MPSDASAAVPPSDLEGALAAWTAALGEEHVVRTATAISAAEQTTFHTVQRIRAILRPASAAEVQACLRIASSHRVAVYPTSTGKNWGYGARVPVRDGSVLVELSRLDRIVHLDEQLGYVVVEPGVTQRQLFAFLRARNSKLWMDTTASSPDASVLANVLERGHGLTPYADHVDFACGYQVALPTGECIRTGYGRFGRIPTAPLDRWGLGPSLDGLFTQSNLGIVTEAAIWLMPAPESFQIAVFAIDGAQFESVVDALRPLRLHRTLRAAPRFGNDYRALMGYTQYPWTEAGGVTPLPEGLRTQLRARHGVAEWNGGVGLYGTAQEVQQQRDAITAALHGRVQKLRFLEGSAVEPDVSPPSSVPPRSMVSAEVARLVGLAIGDPAGSGVVRAYWRKKTAPPEQLDLDRDRVGFIWVTAVTPFVGGHARSVADLIEQTISAHGFEPSIQMMSLRERVLHVHAVIAYDRDVSGEDAQAARCHDELCGKLMDAGYFPHRLGLQSVGVLERGAREYANALHAIKRALDPNDILAPGRYEPER